MKRKSAMQEAARLSQGDKITFATPPIKSKRVEEGSVRAVRPGGESRVVCVTANDAANLSANLSNAITKLESEENLEAVNISVGGVGFAVSPREPRGPREYMGCALMR